MIRTGRNDRLTDIKQASGLGLAHDAAGA